MRQEDTVTWSTNSTDIRHDDFKYELLRPAIIMHKDYKGYLHVAKSTPKLWGVQKNVFPDGESNPGRGGESAES